MHEKEIQYFTEAFQLVEEKFYVDAIRKFQDLVNELPKSDFADDAMYNIGLCYYEMNQFQKCVETLEEMIEKYPEATIHALENENASGKTAAKGYYLIVQCCIGLGDFQKAESYISILENYTNTHVVIDSEKVSFAQLAENAIARYMTIKKNE